MGMDTTISVKNLLVDLELWDGHLMQLEHHILKLHVYFIHFSLMTIPSVLFLYILDHRAID